MAAQSIFCISMVRGKIWICRINKKLSVTRIVRKATANVARFTPRALVSSVVSGTFAGFTAVDGVITAVVVIVACAVVGAVVVTGTVVTVVAISGAASVTS